MKVITKAVTAGQKIDFEFDVSGSRFLIKNFTRSPIACEILGQTIHIPASTSQMLATRMPPKGIDDLTNCISVTAQETSDQGVEIQCMDY